MARQPKKSNAQEYFECPKCNSTFLDVTYIRDKNDNIVDREFDCIECNYAWNSRGEELL